MIRSYRYLVLACIMAAVSVLVLPLPLWAVVVQGGLFGFIGAKLDVIRTRRLQQEALFRELLKAANRIIEA